MDHASSPGEERSNLLPLHATDTVTRQRKGGGRPLAIQAPTRQDDKEDNKTKGPVWRNAWHQRFQDPLRHYCRRQTLGQLATWARTHPRRAAGVLLLIAVILRPSITWKWYTSNFGRHYLQGGYIGKRLLEEGSMRQVYRQTLQRQQDQMRALGIADYPTYNVEEPFRVVNLRFDTAYRTLLVQRETRARTLARLEQESNTRAVPNVLFVPQTRGWNPPRPKTRADLERILYDDQEREQAVLDVCPELGPIYRTLAQSVDKIHVWSLCMLYYYGGYFLGDRIKSNTKIVQGVENGTSNFAFAKMSLSKVRIHGLVATPWHPILKCILDDIAANKSFTSLSNEMFLGREASEEMTFRCSPDDCCRTLEISDSPVSSGGNEAILRVSKGPDAEIDLADYETAHVAISKVEYKDVKARKHPIEAQLRERGIQPSWLCMRCLMMPSYGRTSKCTRFCNPAYADFMCHSKQDELFQEVPVTISRKNHPELVQIPKIIHQTWFEEINLDRYPQLARIQNSWKETGWDYRLYTDASAKNYILDNFPPVFAEAFDVLKPGAFRADFFRYLVLMKEGGVYSDVDVLLETNLDHLIRPGLSFFAPRDVVAEYADEAYCLWNGLIGVVPGHPILIRAVERLVNHIIERADVHDMERAICQKDDDTELWKIHTEALLLLTGPCALGIAMNEALGRPSLKGIDVGWTSLEVPNEFAENKDIGDALILVLDKHDLGGFRFSDPERNLIVASTDFESLDKTARNIVHPSKAEKQRQLERKTEVREHYSKATKGSFVWGSEGIYRDKQVSKFRIKFLVSYI